MPVNATNNKFGWIAPDFNLLDVSGKKLSLNEISGSNGTVIAFICNHCPYVIAIAERLGKEAKELIDQYFNEFSGLKTYMEEVVDDARENGYVATVLGRRRYLKDINSQNAVVRGAAERNAVNAPIQGSAADIIKRAMIRIPPALKAAGIKADMLLQVHDELIFEAPAASTDEAVSYTHLTLPTILLV